MAELTLRNHVRERRRRLGLLACETFVPQSHAWGQGAQVDWCEAWADLGGERLKVRVFAMRSMASGAAFHRACLRAARQALLDAHERAFAYFGGVFRRLRYDNLASAVRRVLRGHRREETARFVAFRSRWRFAAEFCAPGEAHEKGGVEGEGGYFRRNHLVPVPEVAALDALNVLLLAGCRADEARVLSGRTEPIGVATTTERDRLLPLAPERFELVDTAFPVVNKQGCVAVKTNLYSSRSGPAPRRRRGPTPRMWKSGVPAARRRATSAATAVANKSSAWSTTSTFWTASPARSPAPNRCGSGARAGAGPPCYDVPWDCLRARHGRQSGTRAMVAVVALGREFGHGRPRAAVAQAVSLGACDVTAVRCLLTEAAPRKTRPEPIEVGALARYDRPMPTVADYDALLSADALPWARSRSKPFGSTARPRGRRRSAASSHAWPRRRCARARAADSVDPDQPFRPIVIT